ncbi:MAG: hypothetical protein AB8G96_11785 [Phycisphaerales bacterium]
MTKTDQCDHCGHDVLKIQSICPECGVRQAKDEHRGAWKFALVPAVIVLIAAAISLGLTLVIR